MRVPGHTAYDSGSWDGLVYTRADGIECRGSSDNSPADDSLPIIYIGGGACTPRATAPDAGPDGAARFPTVRDTACNDAGLCLRKSNDGCPRDWTADASANSVATDLSARVNSPTSTRSNTTDVGRGFPRTSGFGASTLAADVQPTANIAITVNPTQAQLNDEPHVHVGPYSTIDDGYDNYSDLNVVTLAGVYLIVSIVLSAYTLLTTFKDKDGIAFGLESLLRQVTAANNVEAMLTYLNPIPELVVAGLGAAVVVAAIESFQWQSLAAGDPSYVNATDSAVISETKGIEEPPMLAYQRLMIVIALTVISRTASYMRDLTSSGRNFLRGFSAELISVTASVVNIIYLVTILDDRTDRMKQLATPIFIAFLTFEIIYLVTVVTTRAGALGAMYNNDRGAGGGNIYSSIEFVGENEIVAACQALAVVLALYVSSRRAANLYDITVGSTEVLKGTPFMQLGTRNSLCDFINSDILAKPSDDADAITEAWTGHRACYETQPLTGNATYYAHCCVKNNGTAVWFLRGSIWVPLAVCLARARARQLGDDSRTSSPIRGRYTGPHRRIPVSAEFHENQIQRSIALLAHPSPNVTHDDVEK